MTDPRREPLAKFVQYVHSLKGDEKGEAQVFLDRLFQAFGHEGYKQAGAVLESRVRAKGKSTRFADLVWEPRVLIEMKKRGENLALHYDQARDYWHDTYPKPRYVVLCNFDEFWAYDFYNQSEVIDTITLAELPDRYLGLAFLFPGEIKPQFGKDRVAVSRKAADAVAQVFNELITRGEDRLVAQRFILQCVFCLFAEDFDLLPKGLFTQVIEDCVKGASTYDLFGQLFRQMNSPSEAKAGRFALVKYFNGGLFEMVDPIELLPPEVALMAEAANENWSLVQPPIFGALFEGSMDKEERHAFGAHFTSEADIKKVVRPTIERPWMERIDAAKTLKELQKLRDELLRFHVLDPACGCGNFLYVAYREMRRIEAHILMRIYNEFRGASRKGMTFDPKLSLRQFHGIDINAFAVELAKVTLMLGKEQSIVETREFLENANIETDLFDPALPLDNLDTNIIQADALFTPWPKADAIIGNPPFLGAKRMKPERGIEYIEKVRAKFPDIPGMADYCVYWFRKAHDHLPTAIEKRPTSGRAGLVGTQNVRNNNSREGGLDYIASTGTIVEAVENQPWSGEANVHVSIVNWVKSTIPPFTLEKKRLWMQDHAKKPKRAKGDPTSAKLYALISREVSHISSTLSDEEDLSEARILLANQEPPSVYNGQIPRHSGFVISPEVASAFISTDLRNREVVHPFLIGREMIVNGRPDRWVIDFQKMDVLNARTFKMPFKHVEEHVLPHIQQLAEKEREKTGKDRGQDQSWLRTWWQHFRCRKELIDRIQNLPRFFACSEVTKRPIFEFLHPDIRPDHTLEAFVLPDDYSFGLLQSDIHWQWFIAKCSKLKSDFRYTPESVFDTFPWPQSPTLKQVRAVARAAVQLRALRRLIMDDLRWSLRDLYRTLETPGANPLRDAHEALDEAVRAAYGMKKNEDILAFLLKLNHEVADREGQLLPVVGPGLPPCVTDPTEFITDDCIRVEE